MTIYLITGQTGLQWACRADSEHEALENYDQGVGIDPNNVGLDEIIEQGDLLVEAICNLTDLLEWMKQGDDDGLDWLNRLNLIPTFGGDAPSDTSEIWSWDEEHLLIGACSDEYEIVTREEWGE